MVRFQVALLACFALLLSSSLSTCVRAKVPSSEQITPLLKINGIAVYENLGGSGKAVVKEMNALGLGKITLVDGRHLHSEDGLRFDSVSLVNRLQKVVPMEHAGHLIVLDWEGIRMKEIIRGVSKRTPAYEEAKGQLLWAYRVTKRLYPQAIVGFYGFPARNYWKRNEAWRQQNIAMADFLGEVDAIFPSIYDFYATSVKNRDNELSYVRDNVSAALQLGETLQKPVYPFVWHRYHDSNKQLGLELIPPDEFAEHITAAARTQVKRKGIEGIVWWSSERYFYNIARKKDGKVNAFEQDITPVTSQYLRVLLNALKVD